MEQEQPAIGLEIHQQMDTAEKLFCHCSTGISNEAPQFALYRYLFPVHGELGTTDQAAQYEFQKRKRFVYHVYCNNCLIEMDEEPPQPLNETALAYAIQAALLMNCDVPAEVQVMRKAVIDGSNTTGFQRSCLVGMHGAIQVNGGAVPIENVNIEEDSCGLRERTDEAVFFDLDRLGIPLLEIGTAPVMTDGQQCKEAALQIGQLLRSLPVKRGLGTIRQDVNISMPGGARVEIKGFQDVKQIDTLVNNEMERQRQLIAIKDQLQEHGISEIPIRGDDVSHVFAHSENDMLRTVAEHGAVKAYRVPRLFGYMKQQLCGGKTLAAELADYLRPFGINGFIHNEEDLATYGIVAEFRQVQDTLQAEDDDLVIIIALDSSVSDTALQRFFDRLQYVPHGVPEETRKAERDATTSYLRPLPGSARLYPETDVPPVRVTGSWASQLRETLPETQQERYQRLEREIGGELAQQLVDSEHYPTYERLKETHNPTLVANVLTNTFGKLAQEQVPVGMISADTVDAMLTLYENNTIAKSAFPYILQHCPTDISVAELVERHGLEKASDTEIEQVVAEAISELKQSINNTKALEGKAIGQVMQRLAGRVDGDRVKAQVHSYMQTHTS